MATLRHVPPLESERLRLEREGHVESELGRLAQLTKESSMYGFAGPSEPAEGEGMDADLGASDYRVSRLREAHKHESMDDLLPVWQPEHEREPSLQEAFRRHKQGFIRQSEERLKQVIQEARQRQSLSKHPALAIGARREELRRAEQHGEHSGQAQHLHNKQHIRNAGAEEEPHRMQIPIAANRPKMQPQDIKALNERLYRKLCPEVKEKRKEAAKAELLAQNRARAREFEENLRKQKRKQPRA